MSRLRWRSPIVIRTPLYWTYPGLRLQATRSGSGVTIGPWWCRWTAGLGGWSLYAFKRRLAWKPIDYSKTFIVEGEGRTARLPLIHALDLRRDTK